MAEIFDRGAIEAARKRFMARQVAETSEALEGIVGVGPDASSDTDEMTRYVNRFVQMGHPELAAELLQDRSEGRVPERSALERIIEQNELMAVSFFARGSTASRAVARVIIRNSAGQVRGYGTGFMISPQLMMTNNHVLPSQGQARLAMAEFNYKLGVDGRPMVPQRFRLDPAIFFETSKPLDFTIVGVEPTNDEGDILSSRGWIHLIADSGKAVAGEPINSIQHPGGERQQIAIRENKIVGPDGDFLIYTTDTKQGSSGSPMLNDQWQLAALHHAGVPDEDAAGNWLRRDGGIYRSGLDDPSTVKWVANEGVRISRIVKEMRERRLSPAHRGLFDDTFEPAPLVLESGSDDAESAAAAASSGPVHSGNMSQNAPQSAAGATIGRDGVARWNFELSFGPVAQAAKGSTASVVANTPASPAIQTASARPVIGDGDSLESVFEQRGDYLDEAAEAQAADAYYSEIETNLTKAKRFVALSSLLKSTHGTVFSYSKARHDHLYPWIDRHEDTTLKSIYSGAEMAEELFVAERLAFESAVEIAAERFETTVSSLSDAALEDADALLEATSAFNCEHVVPQSWFRSEDEQKAQKSDLHHLFTCESGCNSFRSNIPYSEFTDAEEQAIRANEVSEAAALLDPELEALRPHCGLRDGRRFEPSAGKGAVARSTLYFVLRYPGVVGDVKSGAKKELVKSNVGTLLEWAEADPPSKYERHRNQEIAKVQGNRNPMIDRPEWLRKIAYEDGFG